MTPPDARASVVIPAFQEERTIARCLEAVMGVGLPLDVVVAANGCTDRTAQVAAGFGVTVLELPQGGKAAALNAADRTTDVFPRLYVDADVVPHGIEALVAALDHDRPMLAVPQRSLDTGGASAVVRSYYRTWERLQQCRGDQLGSGVYAVNAAGRVRWGTFPDGIADDYHVHTRFRPEERVTVEGARSRVHPPRTLASMLAVRGRVHAGNVQHQAQQGRLQRPKATAGPLLRDPVALVGVPVYAAFTVLARARGRRRHDAGDQTWAHDTTART